MQSPFIQSETPDAARTVQPSTCWECGTICGSLLTTENGVVTKISPNPSHPASKGAFCVKGIRGAKEWTYQDGRLRTPLRRTGTRGEGRFEPIGWDEAIGEIADRFAEVRHRYGPMAIAGATNGAFFGRGLMMALLMRSIGSPNWMINQDLCGGCRAVADKMTGLNVGGGEDIDETSCALIVGRNPSVADPIQWMALKRAKAKGASIVVIDPFRTPAAEIADLWLRPRPGTDAAIALAMAHVMIAEKLYDKPFVESWCYGFDRFTQHVRELTPSWAEAQSGVPAHDIAAAARHYARGPACFISGHGIDGSSAGVQTFRAFFTLVAITGNVDRVGGNRRGKKPEGFQTTFDVLFDPNYRLPPEIEALRIGAKDFPLWSGPQGYQMACHNPSVLTAMLTGEPYPVRALYASGANILLTYPDLERTVAALNSLDFVAVGSQYMTPTAAWADIILPKTTTLEEEEVSLHQGGPCVTYTAAASVRQGEQKCDQEIAVLLIEELAKRQAIYRDYLPWKTQSEFAEYCVAKSAIDLAELRRVGYATFPFEQGDLSRQVIATPSGKFELYSQVMEQAGVEALPTFLLPSNQREQKAVSEDFPLVLQTGFREKSYHHSRFREQAWARKVSPHPLVYVHPQTAEQHGVHEGDWIKLTTPRASGTCSLKARITDDTLPGVLTTGMGWWLPEAPAPEFGVRTVNINAAMSYSGPWDSSTGSADTGGIACRILSVSPESEVA
nr:molybdopterin-dependent oxidoreductase [Bradyrhizobium sp. LTSP849]